MTENYKSYIGVDQLYYALVTQDDADAFAAEAPAYLAPLMTISVKPKTNSKTQYADNQPYDALSAEGESEAEVEITGLPLSLQAILLGKVWDAVNGRMYDNGGTPPYVALGYRAKKTDGLFKYYWYLRCRFSPFDEDASTETDTPDPKSTKLKLQAIRTIFEFDLDGSITDSVKRVIGDTAIDDFDAATWFNNVQVPAPGTPASFTCTPSPADGATGVAANVSPTLTFSNPLAGGAENGIVLVRVSTGAVVAAVRSLSANRKVVTLNPNADLTSGAVYHIIVPGVTSIYGQTLADSVFDFTIA